MKTKTKKRKKRQVDPRRVRDTLPDKPSALIRVAIADLQEVRKSEDHVVDMGVWHASFVSSSSPLKCHVCLAGAVMARSLRVGPRRQCVPGLFVHTLSSKLRALNYFRIGDVNSGLEELGHWDKSWPDRGITMYEHSWRGFKRDMLQLARDLEEEGL